ncbi:MAG: MotE family protein [Rhodomicrobium sp.]
MKRPARTQRVLVIQTAACLALAGPAWAEQAPTWGWKPEEVAHYKEFLKPKKPENPWSTTVAGPPAAGQKPAGSKAEEGKAPGAAETPATIKAYCQNIEDPALDARFLNQKAELSRLEGELEKRTSLLEAKRAEYQLWLQRRDEFVAKAEGSLVALYSKIKPDAAAMQLADLDEEAAAALLLRLSPRSASAILNQMDSAKAARLVSVMIGAAKRPEKAAAPENPPAPDKAPPKEASASPEAGKEQAAQQAQPAEKKL